MREWENFLILLDQEFGQKTVDEWVRSLKILRFDARNLYLEATNPIQVAWFEEHVRPRLKTSFCNSNQSPIKVHLNTAKEENKTIETKIIPFKIGADRLDPEFTFENFLLFSQNKVAFQLLSEIEKPSFNPIYLFGPKRAGKTHLLTAAAHFLQKKGKNAFFIKAETFTSHVVQAIRLGAMTEFRRVYREIDALMIDGIEVLAKKNATQEEFFHTFNALHMAGKPILISSHLPPSKLTEIEPRLMSRFEWGISLQIESGDPFSILQKKTALWKLSFSYEVIQWIASSLTKDPLLALQALSLRAKGISLTLEKAKSLLQDFTSREEEKTLSSKTILQTIANHYGILTEDILGKSHAREYAYPRQMAMFFCRDKLKLQYQKIGEIFHRDHSTVMTSIRQIQKSLEEKKQPTQSDVQTISDHLQQYLIN